MKRHANAAFGGTTPQGRGAGVVGWKTRRRARWIVEACYCLALVSLLAQQAAAQLEIGNDLSMNLSGNVGLNYNGSVNGGDSEHNLGLAGDLNLHGYFYSPRFLSFSIEPYYDRAQNNSLFGTVTNSSGVTSSVNLFSGSHFPGTISYARAGDASGSFGVPGSQVGLAEHGNNQNFAINWSAIVAGWPTLTATYSIGDSSSSIFGSPDESNENNRNLILLSTYKADGFRLTGGFTHRTTDIAFTDSVEGTPELVNSGGSSNSYQASVQHSFPMQGSWSVSWSRSAYRYNFHDSTDSSNSGASDTLSGSLSFLPVNKLSVGIMGNYTDSLMGSLPDQAQSGVVGSLGSFHSFLLGAEANYQLFRNLSVRGNVNHVQEEFLGNTYSANFFGGSANYNLNRNFLGSFSFSLAAFDTANQEGNSNLGFVSNVNFHRKVQGWELNANYSYSQNVQTLILVYTTSSMGYVTNARRRLGNRTFFMAGYSGTHSGISQNAGTMNSSEQVSSSLSFGKYSMNGFYSTSKGTAFFTPTGLVAVPTGLPPSALSQDSLMLFNSKSYGFNASGTFIRRLNLSAGYAKSSGDTTDPNLSTFTRNDLINAQMQYRLRKVFLNGGYTRLRQSVGTPGMSPVVVTSYFIGFSRWFNFF